MALGNAVDACRGGERALRWLGPRRALRPANGCCLLQRVCLPPGHGQCQLLAPSATLCRSVHLPPRRSIHCLSLGARRPSSPPLSRLAPSSSEPPRRRPPRCSERDMAGLLKRTKSVTDYFRAPSRSSPSSRSPSPLPASVPSSAPPPPSDARCTPAADSYSARDRQVSPLDLPELSRRRLHPPARSWTRPPSAGNGRESPATPANSLRAQLALLNELCADLVHPRSAEQRPRPAHPRHVLDPLRNSRRHPRRVRRLADKDAPRPGTTTLRQQLHVADNRVGVVLARRDGGPPRPRPPE